MIDLPANNVQIVQEYVLNESQTHELSTEAFYQMSETDLSFCDALAGVCSGEASSAPIRTHGKENS